MTKRTDRENQAKFHQYIIVGAGPAGIQLAYFFGKRGRDYLVLERGKKAGTFFATHPRHRQLISINKVETGFDDPQLNMRWDWNSLISEECSLLFKSYSQSYFPQADDLVTYLNDFAQKHGAKIQYNSDVIQISKYKDGLFHLRLRDGQIFTCRTLIMATGFEKPSRPDIPGIDLADDYSTMSIDKEAYRGSKVMIIGKGNSAFETADHLSDVTQSIHMVSPEGLTLAWQSHYVGNLRAVNNNLLDTYQLKSQNTIIDGTVEKIERRENKLTVTIRYDHAMVDRIEVPVDHVITCTGFKTDASIFDANCQPELCYDGKFPALTSEWESKSVANLFYAGTLMHGRDFRKTFSGFIHGFRYNIEKLDRILDVRNHGGSMANKTMAFGTSAMPIHMLERIHLSSSLFQQPNFLCDVVQLNAARKTCCYYEDIGLDYLFDGNLLPSNQPYLTLTMEYGEVKHADPFNMQTHPTVAAESNFLHPVLRLYENGNQIANFHFMEDLENNWYQLCYLEEFVSFLENVLNWTETSAAELFAERQPGYEYAARVVNG